MTPPYLDAAAVSRMLPLPEAIEVVERGFAERTAIADPPRTAVEVAAGQLLLMPSHTREGVGVKIVSIGTDNPARGAPRIQGVYVLMDADTLTPRVLMDGSAVTGVRTPATSAVATRRLAVDQARTLVVLGAGPQAEAHAHAMRAVRPIEAVRVVARTAGAAEELARRLRGQGLAAAPGTAEDLPWADIVCACTTARSPVVGHDDVSPHAHVNAIGSHEPDVREVDSRLVAAAQIAVETRAAALAEAGDLLIPLRAGEVDDSVITWDLGELIRGDGPEPDTEHLSLFKSVGIAFEDLLVADEIARRWAVEATPKQL